MSGIVLCYYQPYNTIRQYLVFKGSGFGDFPQTNFEELNKKMNTIDHIRNELIKPVKATDDLNENLTSLKNLRNTILKLINYYNKKVIKRNTEVNKHEDNMVKKMSLKLKIIAEEFGVEITENTILNYDGHELLKELKLEVKN